MIDRVNFKKNEKTYDAEKSAVFKVLQEEQNDPEPGIKNKYPYYITKAFKFSNDTIPDVFCIFVATPVKDSDRM